MHTVTVITFKSSATKMYIFKSFCLLHFKGNDDSEISDHGSFK